MAKTDPIPSTPGAKLAQRWIAELDTSEKWMTSWRKRGKEIVSRYKDERPNRQLNERKFAILWSNIQTLGPAVYARTPQAVVMRRYKDQDPVGRSTSEVLERASNFSLDVYDFDERIKLARDDYLLVGRGQVWVRYEPTFEPVKTPVRMADGSDDEPVFVDDAGERYEEAEEENGQHYIEEHRLAYEEVLCDHVAWDDFGTNPARTWAEVTYVWRRVAMTRAELEERFGEKGAQVPLDFKPEDDRDGKEGKKALIYEIWDKPSRKRIHISKSWPQDVLEAVDDPLNLRDFFPCPRPLMATCAPDSSLPIADYIYYQDQAEEINELTMKIGRLTDALRMVGFYSGEHKTQLDNAFSPNNQSTLIPVADWQSLKEGGGAKGIIEWVPIDMVVATIQSCFEARRQILEDVYQITGISDIIRGASDPNETATAQGIKAQWGSLRVRDRQKELARFARDVIRIKAEIISEKFSPETLKAMTGVQLPTRQEQQQAMMQAQQAQATGQPPPPELQHLLNAPTWEDVTELLHNDAMRTFRVDIETDSTIEPNEQEEKQARVEFVQVLGGVLQEALPAVQAAPPLGKLVAESVKFLVRGFRVGREMEDTIDQVVDEIGQMPAPTPEQQPAPEPPDPAEQQAKVTTANARMLDAQVGAQQAQTDAQLGQADLMLRLQQQQLDQQALARDPRPQVVRNN